MGKNGAFNCSNNEWLEAQYSSRHEHRDRDMVSNLKAIPSFSDPRRRNNAKLTKQTHSHL